MARATDMGQIIPLPIHPFPRRRVNIAASSVIGGVVIYFYTLQVTRYVCRHHPFTLESYFERMLLSLMIGPSIRTSVVRNLGRVAEFALPLYAQPADWYNAIGRIANDELICKFILNMYEAEQYAWPVRTITMSSR